MERDSIDSFIEALEKQDSTFTLLLGQVIKDTYLNLYLVTKGSVGNHLLKPVAGFGKNSQDNVHWSDDGLGFNSLSHHQRKWDCRVVQSYVELIHFQGPHYSDRYGIAYAAIKAIGSKGITIMASGCSVSCVYLVLAEGQGEVALEILKEKFEVPGKRKIKE